jgi:hypothetical protein
MSPVEERLHNNDAILEASCRKLIRGPVKGRCAMADEPISTRRRNMRTETNAVKLDYIQKEV